MKTQFYTKCSFAFVVLLLLTTNLMSQVVPIIAGPTDPVTGMPATLGNGTTPNQVYSTGAGTGYLWTVSTPAGSFTGQGTSSITVTWTNPTGQQTVSVSYTDPNGIAVSGVLIVNYYPFPAAINPTTIPKFVDPLPHFAAGLRVNAKAAKDLFIKTFLIQQIALSKGTPVTGGIIDPVASPTIGLGNYAGYGISTDGINYPVKMWPAQTIETQQGNPLTVKYENGLTGITYDYFNILADQTLMMNGFTLNGDPKTEPYRGDIPMVVHLHGGEMPSGSDGGPSAWFTPGFKQMGPTFKFNQSSLSYYPNMQEATTLWYHPHDDGLTRINVYTGLAGYYLLRGANEEQANLPGWSGDDKVREITPLGTKYSPTFNGTNAYLPEVEIAIQDRMFNVDGALYWPVAPTNPDIHPFWTPEFVGDVMTVNGKSWPYLSVAPRKYRFRMLEGCNARMLNLWLAEITGGDPFASTETTVPGPIITVIGGEGGLLATPAPIDPSLGQKLLMAPGQRYDVIIDFTGLAGKTFTLMNNAPAPYPTGTPTTPGIDDRIMQFVVNGEMVSVTDPNPANATGTDNSKLPLDLRPASRLVQLTDFAGNLSANVTPVVRREIILNEVTGAGGPAAVLVNNSYFDALLSINPSDPYRVGGPTEFQLEGTTEKVSIINTTADAHPIHIHLVQWQLVSRQNLDVAAYMTVYNNAWTTQHPGVLEFPAGLGYPGGAGTPFPYSTVNGNGAIGGNPAIPAALLGPIIPANPEERGWKDNVIVLPGQVTTFVVRVTPTEKPIIPDPNKPPLEQLFPFDPSIGPGYVWHCHIVDHEDMSMMRPLPILPSPLRFPQITGQPQAVTACIGDVATFSVTATSIPAITYQWKVSTDAGVTFNPLSDGGAYQGSATSSLKVTTAALLNGYIFQCDLTNIDGITTSGSALLTVNSCSVSGTVKYNNQALDPIAGATVSIGGITAVTDAAGAFTVNGVTSGALPVVITNALPAGGVNLTDAGSITAWPGTAIPTVNYLAGDVDKSGLSNLDAQAIQQNFVAGATFTQTPWVYFDAASTTSVIPPALTVNVNGTSVTGFGILARSTGDFNGSFSPVTPGVSTVLLASTGNAIKVPITVPFNLPINSASALQVGAISLILNVPSTLVTVNSVSVAGSITPATFSFAGNLLKIGWYSSIPVNIAAGGNLVVLTLTPTAGFTTTQTLRPTLVASYLNELADGLFNPIANPSLTVDNVQVTAKTSTAATTLALIVSPNPATTTTNITYTLPADGAVTLAFYNNKGVTALPVSPLTMTAGTWTISGFNVSSLIKGTYYLRITFIPTAPGGIPQSMSVKFMKK